MPKKRKRAKKNNIKLGIVFSALIILLIAASGVSRIAHVWQQGKYDSSYPFSIKVESGKNTAFISLSPKEKTASILYVSDLEDTPYSLAIPVEGEVTASLKSPLDIPSFFKSLLGNNSAKINLTSIDLLRLYLLSKSISSNDVKSATISASDSALDKIVSSLFLDKDIEAEGKRIEVINATGVYGVGNNVAKLLANMGANVVFVSTADKNEKKSIIYYRDGKTYTVKRLERVLGFEAIKNTKESISDITVQIGEESLELVNQ